MISANFGKRHLSLDISSEPLDDRLAVRTPPSAKVADLPVPLDSQKLSGQFSPLKSPTHSSRIEKLPNVPRSTTTNIPPPIGLARQSTLVDSLAPQDTSEKPNQDCISAPPSQPSLFPTAASTVSPLKDCPRIDLIALVREKQKTKKVQKKKPSVFLLREDPHRRVDPRGHSSEGFR